MSGLPSWTSICLLVALGLLALILGVGLAHLFWWRRGARELREIRRQMQAEHGRESHRNLHRTFEDVKAEMWNLAGGRRRAAKVLDALLEPVTLYHDRRIVGASGQWEDLRDPYLERVRWPIRLTRGAAGWMVLIGLAGTVLGFSEAVPALRAILVEEGHAQETTAQSRDTLALDPSAPVSDSSGTKPGGENVSAARKLSQVLNEVKGVFFATFGGVLGALVLSVFSVAFLDPAFNRFANEVDLLGARWFAPMIHPPESIIDETLRAELRDYFAEVARGLKGPLEPLVSTLMGRLEDMSSLATDFSQNIARGRDTLATFHAAVADLGTTAHDAVKELKNIVTVSTGFLAETRSLQEDGRKQLESIAKALGDPVNNLADSASAIENKVQALDAGITRLSSASDRIAQAVDQHRFGEDEIKDELANASGVLEKYLQADNRVAESSRGSLDQLVGIASAYGDLLKRTESWQQETRHEFAEIALASIEQAAATARSSAAIEATAQRLEQDLSALNVAASRLSEVVSEQQRADATLKTALTETTRELAAQTKQLDKLLRELNSREAATAAALKKDVLPRLAALPKDLIEAQRLATREDRGGHERLAEALARVEAVVKAWQEVLVSNRPKEGDVALTNGWKDLQAGIDNLRFSVDALRLQMAQADASIGTRRSPKKTGAAKKDAPGPTPSEPVPAEILVDPTRLLQEIHRSTDEMAKTTRSFEELARQVFATDEEEPELRKRPSRFGGLAERVNRFLGLED